MNNKSAHFLPVQSPFTHQYRRDHEMSRTHVLALSILQAVLLKQATYVTAQHAAHAATHQSEILPLSKTPAIYCYPTKCMPVEQTFHCYGWKVRDLKKKSV